MMRAHANRAIENFWRGPFLFVKRIWRLVNKPVFISLTVFGNTVILSAASLLYFVERDINPNLNDYLAAIWWAVSTVTTVGYGDVTPQTNLGRVIGIGLMIVGTSLFWCYTALFAEAVLAKDISDIEDDIRNLESSIKKLHQNDVQKVAELERLILTLRDQVKS